MPLALLLPMLELIPGEIAPLLTRAVPEAVGGLALPLAAPPVFEFALAGFRIRAPSRGGLRLDPPGREEEQRGEDGATMHARDIGLALADRQGVACGPQPAIRGWRP